MALEYTNRKGDRYFALRGQTTTGKPKYYCSRKPKGDTIDFLPPEFEFYEHPSTALVTIRKVKPLKILPTEKTALEGLVRKLTAVEFFIIEATEAALIVYTSTQSRGNIHRFLMQFVGPHYTEAQRLSVAGLAQYQQMFRFELLDEKNRLFGLDRWCFRGSVDDWVPIHTPPKPLKELAYEFLPHLDQQSFYHLF